MFVAFNVLELPVTLRSLLFVNVAVEDEEIDTEGSTEHVSVVVPGSATVTVNCIVFVVVFVSVASGVLVKLRSMVEVMVPVTNGVLVRIAVSVIACDAVSVAVNTRVME